MQSRRLVALSDNCLRGASIPDSHYSSSQLHSAYQQRLSKPSLLFASSAFTGSIPLPIYQPAIRIEECCGKIYPSSFRQMNNFQQPFQTYHHAAPQTTQTYAVQQTYDEIQQPPHMALSSETNFRNNTNILINGTINSTDILQQNALCQTDRQDNGRVVQESTDMDDNTSSELVLRMDRQKESKSCLPESSKYLSSIEHPELRQPQCVESDGFRSILKGRI